MPKSSQKTRAKKGRPGTQESTQIDFTLADYADSANPAAASIRMKKGAANALINEVKKNRGKAEEVAGEVAGEDVSWFEKDLSDFGSDEEPRDQDQSTEQKTGRSLRSPAKKTLKRSCRQLSEEDGVEYPVDLWFHIGRHIEPEDVGRFAAICCSSHFVAHTAQFWTNLYNRYPAVDVTLPECLQPAFINKVHGLRTRVIRALFYTYPLFTQRLQQTVPFDDTSEGVLGSQCVLLWYQKVKSLWHFNFKFFKTSKIKPGCPLTPSKIRRRGKYSLENFDTDLYDNPDEGYTVLQVASRTFISIPPTIMGMTLYKTSVSVGHGMMNHKLKMIFTPQSGCVEKAVALAGGTTISLDPVLNMRVLHWWDPKYPR